MTPSENATAEADPQLERRTHILDAAQRCFARAGFHGTTMQVVAAEAGMSPGNLYRYFPSKDAIIAGLSERDRAELAKDFAALFGADDFLAAFAKLGRKHLQENPRERAILCLEIWAEATRNPEVAKMCGEIDHILAQNMQNAFHQAQAQGVIPASVDGNAVALLISILGDGLFVRRATSADFNYEHDVGLVLRLIGALLKGNVTLPALKAPS